MKKILFLSLLFIGFATVSKAQTKLEATLVSQYSLAVDTVDNTETIYLSLTTSNKETAKAYFKTAIVVFKALEISGTGAGTATLEESANGTDYAASPGNSAYTILDQVAAQTSAWKIVDFAGKSFRIKITGAGTMSYKVYGAAYLKK